MRKPLAGRELGLGRAMGLPVVWRRPGDRLGATGLVGAWRADGRAALHIVGGRGITLDTRLATSMADGLARLLGHLGMVAARGSGETVADVSHSDVESHRASCGGFFVPEVRVGDRVEGGHLLGSLRSPVGGTQLGEVRASRSGVVMTVRAYPLVHAQELLVRVASVR